MTTLDLKTVVEVANTPGCLYIGMCPEVLDQFLLISLQHCHWES